VDSLQPSIIRHAPEWSVCGDRRVCSKCPCSHSPPFLYCTSAYHVSGYIPIDIVTRPIHSTLSTSWKRPRCRKWRHGWDKRSQLVRITNVQWKLRRSGENGSFHNLQATLNRLVLTNPPPPGSLPPKKNPEFVDIVGTQERSFRGAAARICCGSPLFDEASSPVR
jgi:hypothetical protein